jgi:hypothetical protein
MSILLYIENDFELASSAKIDSSKNHEIESKRIGNQQQQQQ